MFNQVRHHTHRAARVAAAAVVLCSSAAMALSLADLTEKDANAGLKSAMEQGSIAAVSKLGVADGFLNNDRVRIQLPGKLTRCAACCSSPAKAKNR